MLIRIILPIVAYLLGSIPWGLVITRIAGLEDIRKRGSGNIGATNVRRIAGAPLAVLTLIGDMGKGALPVWPALLLTDLRTTEGALYVSLVALSALAGHVFPVYFKFRGGGKGVATAAGAFVVLTPTACIISGLIFLAATWIVDRVSVGSLAAAALLPVSVWLSTRSLPLTGAALLTAGIIFVRHTDNINRLRSGSEPTFRRPHRQ